MEQKAKRTESALRETPNRVVPRELAACQFILRCVRGNLSGAPPPGIPPGKELDWELLRTTALRHGVLPLVCRSLETRNGAIPEAAALQADYRTTAAANLAMTGELFRLLDHMAGAGIDAVPFKGPVLAQAAYGDLSLRQFGDLDILARRRDVQAARDVLAAQGYRIKHPSTRAREAIFLTTEHHIPFEHEPTGICVELHCEVAPWYFSFPLATGAILARLEPVELAGRTVMAFSAEDRLLFLAMHGTKHLWDRLELICAIAALISRRPPDWDLLSARAQESGGRRMLLLALKLAKEWLGARLPGSIVAAIESEPELDALSGDVDVRLFGAADPTKLFLEKPRFHMRARERLGDRIRYCLRLGLSPNWDEIRLFPLPPFLFPLYRVLRPLRVALWYCLARLSQLLRARRDL